MELGHPNTFHCHLSLAPSKKKRKDFALLPKEKSQNGDSFFAKKWQVRLFCLSWELFSFSAMWLPFSTLRDMPNLFPKNFSDSECHGMNVMHSVVFLDRRFQLCCNRTPTKWSAQNHRLTSAFDGGPCESIFVPDTQRLEIYWTQSKCKRNLRVNRMVGNLKTAKLVVLIQMLKYVSLFLQAWNIYIHREFYIEISNLETCL